MQAGEQPWQPSVSGSGLARGRCLSLQVAAAGPGSEGALVGVQGREAVFTALWGSLSQQG